jgi:heme oxygenase
MKPSPNSSADILDLLKSCTADVHERLEQQLHIFAPEFDLSAYVRLLAQFYGFWAPVEAHLLTVPELRHPALALETRLKSHLLEADLRVFGIDPVLVPVCSGHCQLDDVKQSTA